MAKQKGMQNAGTNAQEVKQQNRAAAGAQNQDGQYKTEFGSETNAQSVRQKNQQSQQKKGQNQQ